MTATTAQKAQIIKDFQRAGSDTGSPEVQVANCDRGRLKKIRNSQPSSSEPFLLAC